MVPIFLTECLSCSRSFMYIVSNLHNNFEKAIIHSHFIVEEEMLSNEVTCPRPHRDRILSHGLMAPSSALCPASPCFISELNYRTFPFLKKFYIMLKVTFHLQLLKNIGFITLLYNTSLSLPYTQYLAPPPSHW